MLENTPTPTQRPQPATAHRPSGPQATRSLTSIRPSLPNRPAHPAARWIQAKLARTRWQLRHVSFGAAQMTSDTAAEIGHAERPQPAGWLALGVRNRFEVLTSA